MDPNLDTEGFVRDYCRGVKDRDLRAKYNVSAKDMVILVRRLISEGLISKEDYFDRNRRIEELEAHEEKAFLQSLYHCPVCSHIQPMPFTVCPACGTDIGKYQQTDVVDQPRDEEFHRTPSAVPTEPLDTLKMEAEEALEEEAVGEEVGGIPEHVQAKLDLPILNVVPLPDSPHTLEGCDYVITDVLLSETLCATFKAEDLSGAWPTVVVKLFHAEALPGLDMGEFLDKVVMYQSGMNDRNLVRVLATAQVQNDRVLLSEYMPATLETLLKAEPAGLSLDALDVVLPQMFNAVGYSHMHRSKDGVVRRIPHLRLKLSSFLYDESTSMVKLADCGVWRALVDVRGHKHRLWEEPDAELSSLGPECFVQESKFINGFLADIYSLGAVIYRVVTGKVPFAATTVEDYSFAHLRTFAIPPRVHRYTIPAWLDAMVLKCLEKEPAKRWRSATLMELSIGKDLLH